MIAVVIPYFQREPGILVKALNSIFQSEGVSDVHIIVVDDQSPISAKKEIATLGSTRFPITVIEQTNTGPGGARNKGLDNLPPETAYVAFLDSDDVWSPRHLQNALIALSAGYDVYFCDLFQLGAEVSAFRRAGRIDPDQHPNIPGQSELYAYQGDMFDQIITGNIIGTSTVVFDFTKFSKLRFRNDLTTAGEDYLFWLELASKGASFSFGSHPDVTYGKGVNVYAGSGWGTDGHARRILDELMYRKALVSLYQLNYRQSQIIESAINKLKDQFIADFIHRATHRKSIEWNLVWSMFKVEPLIAFRGILTLPNKISALVRR